MPTMPKSNKSSQSVTIDSLPDLMTIAEVADLLRVSPLTIKRWGKKGKLPAIRINSRGDRRYKKEVVLAVINGEDMGFEEPCTPDADKTASVDQSR
jgi:excisionase family DNA binding protein